MNIKVAIIDDETPARKLIRRFLEKYPNIEIIGEAADGLTGLKLINSLKPDLVFMDIKMPKISGLEMVEVLSELPVIIFTTAYTEFAIEAFEKNAIDYLLKPFSAQRFEQALNKAIESMAKNDLKKTETKNSNGKLQRIVIKNNNSLEIITLDELYMIEAQDDYVFVYTQKSRFLKLERMKFLEENLDEQTFIRIHRSYIININHVTKIELLGKDSYIAILTNGLKAKISKERYKKLKQILRI